MNTPVTSRERITYADEWDGYYRLHTIDDVIIYVTFPVYLAARDCMEAGFAPIATLGEYGEVTAISLS